MFRRPSIHDFSILCGPYLWIFQMLQWPPPKSVLFMLNPNQGGELGVLPHQCSVPKTKSQLLAVSNKNATLVGTTNDDPGPYLFGEISSQLKMNEPSKPMEWTYWSSWKWPQINWLVGKSEYMMAETSNMRLRCHRHDKEWSPAKRTCRTWQDMHMIGLIHEAPEVTLTKATSSTSYEVPTKIGFRNTTAMPMQNSGPATTCYK